MNESSRRLIVSRYERLLTSTNRVMQKTTNLYNSMYFISSRNTADGKEVSLAFLLTVVLQQASHSCTFALQKDVDARAVILRRTLFSGFAQHDA